MNRVLVTGVTGKSGQYFLKELVAHADELNDYHFRIFIRSTTDTRSIDEASKLISIEKFVGDKTDPNDVDSFMQGEYDTLLHISSIRDSIRMVTSALAHGVSRLILVHTTGIYSKYKSASAEYIAIDEKVYALCSESEVSLTVLRPTMIYGSQKDNNMSVFIRLVDKFRICPTVNGAKYALQPVWCGDLGKAYFQVLMSPETTRNKAYNLSGAEVIELIDILKLMSERLGTKTVFVSLPYPLAYFGACCLFLLTLGRRDYREKVQRLVEPRVFDHDAATRDFDYSPKPFREAVIPEIEEYIAIKAKKEAAKNESRR